MSSQSDMIQPRSSSSISALFCYTREISWRRGLSLSFFGVTSILRRALRHSDEGGEGRGKTIQ